MPLGERLRRRLARFCGSAAGVEIRGDLVAENDSADDHIRLAPATPKLDECVGFIAPAAVMGELEPLEQYLDSYLRSAGLTFDEWMGTFGRGLYHERNQTILRLLAPYRPRRIFEFACAGGFLARLLLENVSTIERYTCTNFSPRVVEYCKKQLSHFRQCEVGLINADVVSANDIAQSGLDDYDTFVTTSLEHIEHDFELIGQFPPGGCFVFCVAGFEDPEHYRVFDSAAGIRDRYGDVLTIGAIEELGQEVRKYVTIAWTK
jgi:SAM-dependent methyltransferase